MVATLKFVASMVTEAGRGGVDLDQYPNGAMAKSTVAHL
jgi:hypothetical protein